MNRHVDRLASDASGMQIRTVLAFTLLLIALMAGCSSEPPHPSPSTGSQPVTTAASTTAATVVDAITADACRSIATDERLSGFWRKVANGEAVIGADAVLAGGAITDLEQYTGSPELPPAVADAMRTATREVRAMLAADMSSFDIDAFKAAITPVVTECQDAGIEMTVPD